MSTVICPECKKHGKIKPVEHPSDKEKPYFKCEDCGALFDEKSEIMKFLGGVTAVVGTALAIFLGAS